VSNSRPSGPWLRSGLAAAALGAVGARQPGCTARPSSFAPPWPPRPPGVPLLIGPRSPQVAAAEAARARHRKPCRPAWPRRPGTSNLGGPGRRSSRTVEVSAARFPGPRDPGCARARSCRQALLGEPASGRGPPVPLATAWPSANDNGRRARHDTRHRSRPAGSSPTRFAVAEFRHLLVTTRHVGVQLDRGLYGPADRGGTRPSPPDL